MPIYVEVAVKVPQVMGVFHYHLPSHLEGQVNPGQLVEAPFGKQKAQGVVLCFVDRPAVPETRPITGVIDSQAVLTFQQIALARELAHNTLASLADCIDLMIPPGLSKMADTLYELAAGAEEKRRESSRRSPLADRLIALLAKRGPLRGRQIDQALPRQDWRASSKNLIRQGLLHSRPVLPPPGVQPKFVRTAALSCSPEQALSAMPDLGKTAKPLQRRQAMLQFLMNEGGPVAVAWIYASSGGNLADLRFLADRGLVILGESEILRDPLENLDFVPVVPPPLTSAQQAVWKEVYSVLLSADKAQPPPPMLLHGVTGSGKTEIYLRAVEETLRMGKQAIVLVPEVALTPQTVRRFSARFPGQVGIAHHQLSLGERYDTWRRARSGQIGILVGPRSALFAPFPRLGLIVIDEFHDDSYYQSDPSPHYHARDAAISYARLAGALCLMGSATPDVSSRAEADPEVRLKETGSRFRYLSLPSRILAHRQIIEAQAAKLGIQSRYQLLSDQAETIDLPTVHLVDMRQELKAGNTSVFSRKLQTALAEVLERKQQAILFLNRRGSATYVFCRDCGYTLKCPRCDIPLTAHVRDTGQASFQPSTLPGLFGEKLNYYAIIVIIAGSFQKPAPSAQVSASANMAPVQNGW
jgi:primosomal protein N' (replication factor Y) (superfamily II helicase)